MKAVSSSRLCLKSHRINKSFKKFQNKNLTNNTYWISLDVFNGLIPHSFKLPKNALKNKNLYYSREDEIETDNTNIEINVESSDKLHLTKDEASELLQLFLRKQVIDKQAELTGKILNLTCHTHLHQPKHFFIERYKMYKEFEPHANRLVQHLKKLAALNSIFFYPNPMHKIYFTPHETYVDLRIDDETTLHLSFGVVKSLSAVDVLNEFDLVSDDFFNNK